MATIKSYTDIEQSKKLAGILPLESADMWWLYVSSQGKHIAMMYEEPDPHYLARMESYGIKDAAIRCWSLAALLNILHSKAKDIPSLSGGGYKDGKYISDWCLDYEFENGDYQKTFADNPIDACVDMILKLHELNLS